MSWSHPGEAQLQFYNLATPCRAVDTRSTNAPPVPAATERKFIIKSGACPIPTDAKTVTLSVTVLSATYDGFLVLWPTNGTYPPSSNLTFLAGETIANGAIVPLCALGATYPLCPSGTPDLSVAYGNAFSIGSVHVVLDITGYFK
jgi:hypothetical protein